MPFADHNAMIDPSTPDLTAACWNRSASMGKRIGDPAVDRGVAYLRRTQEADGSWFGRWGVNYIYGTWQALVGLAAVGVPTDDPMIVAGANWLSGPSAAVRRLGRIGRQLRRAAAARPGTGHRLANRLGRARPDRRRACTIIRPSPAACDYLLDAAERRRHAGTNPNSPAPASRVCSICGITIIRIYFPLLALSRWAKATGKAEVHESEIANA